MKIKKIIESETESILVRMSVEDGDVVFTISDKVNSISLKEDDIEDLLASIADLRSELSGSMLYREL